MGQGLADLLSGAAGAPVNRPQLNAFVANSQARNGLVSAQTQDALIKASQAQEEQEARGRLKSSLIGGGMKESDAQLATDYMIGGFGNAEVANKAVGQVKLGYGTAPEQVQGEQMFGGKIAPLQNVSENYAVPPGQTPPTVLQSPEGKAHTADVESQMRLRDAQTAAGGFNPNGGGNRRLDPVQAAEVAEFIRQNPNLSGNMRSLLSNGGPDVIHAFLHPEAGAAPSAPLNGITPAPGVSLKEQADIRKAFSSGVESRQAGALNTMILHSQLFDALADQMGNGNFTPTNYINQLWQRTMGSPAPSNLHIAGDFLGREAVRATVNAGAGTGAERELAVDNTSSPDALHGAANTLRSLGAGQLHSLDVRAQRGGVDIAQLLGPEAQAVFGRRPVKGGPAPPVNAQGAAGGALPSYPDEDSARAAGHANGDRVIIGGRPGTLQ